MELRAGEARKRDVASDLQLLALRGPAEKPQAGGDDALVHLAVAHEVLVLAMGEEGLVEHLAVVHAAAHHARALDAAAVVGEGDGAVRHHIAHLGDDLALETLGASARRVHVAMALAGGNGLHVFDHGAVIGHRIGVGHRADAGEAALHSGAGFALDGALVLVAGLAQMHMHVHEAGNEILTSKIDNLAAVICKIDVHFGDLIALDFHIKAHRCVDLGIDNISVLKQQGHYRHLQAADTGQPCARRYPRTPGRESRSAPDGRPYRNRTPRRG